jgi:hypothetical protein
MKRKDKIFKAFKGAQADANKGQAMSPGTGATGGTRGRGRDPSAQFSGNNNLSQKNKNALNTQRKGARAAISPSTTTGNQIAGAVMNAIIPFSGTLYKKSIDSKAMGYGRTKKKTVMAPPTNNGGNDRGQNPITPIVANKPIDPLLIKPKENFFNFVAYNVGGLSGGVRYGPPPKRGPNSQVPPVKMKKGGYKK